ncbi:hypothetical protein [Bacillus cereus]|uniref:hypothetical protein n=1 Tax=Bacillus cereus TaxID=1396 RepID=UPI000BF8D885|nr:hypothetical protein [Bacillus cereus]PEX30043.1 hypothetical protein CN458_00095 [Bacillus cereus]PFT89996.1 hypothetical protein COK66_22890 [Bacillus cereus]PGM79889.1 hypothetical protein CN956_21390 [Bacillus cereus]PGU50109.1 hypothetical protein COD72_28065 [Bacillus cereus]
MSIMLITYDLIKPAQNYDALYKEIESLGDSIHPLESVWLVKTELSSKAILERLFKVADKNDTLLVTLFGRNGEYFAYLNTEDIKWIENNL